MKTKIESDNYTLKSGEIILSPEEVEQKFQKTKAARIAGAESKEKETLDEVEIALKKYGKTAKGRAIFGEDEDVPADVNEEMEVEFEEAFG